MTNAELQQLLSQLPPSAQVGFVAGQSGFDGLRVWFGCNVYRLENRRWCVRDRCLRACTCRCCPPVCGCGNPNCRVVRQSCQPCEEIKSC